LLLDHRWYVEHAQREHGGWDLFVGEHRAAAAHHGELEPVAARWCRPDVGVQGDGLATSDVPRQRCCFGPPEIAAVSIRAATTV
jgi:hypothetical protein